MPNVMDEWIAALYLTFRFKLVSGCSDRLFIAAFFSQVCFRDSSLELRVSPKVAYDKGMYVYKKG
jgi:hypothetical protein